MASTSEKALAVVTATPPKVQSLHFLRQARAALAKRAALIFRTEREAACHAIALGMLLWQVKGTLPKGEFKKWIEANIEGRGYRSCAYWMKLALCFAEKSGLKADECSAVAQWKPKGKGNTGAAKLDKFVGELSLNELMIKHGLRGVGLKGELTAGDEAPPAITAGEQLELLWSQAYEPAKSLADLLTERAATLAPDRRDAIAAELNRALQALRAV